MGKVEGLNLDQPQVTTRQEGATLGPVVAELLAPPREGTASIHLGDGEPIAARCTREVCRELAASPWATGQEALVTFERGDPERPIVVALMAPVTEEQQTSAEVNDADADDKRVLIRGDEQLELRCGKASIVLRKDGKVIVRGTNLLSRSTGGIRLKGGHVEIN